MDLSGLEWVLEQICAETCWALPAHVNRKKDEKWKITLDLLRARLHSHFWKLRFYFETICGRSYCVGSGRKAAGECCSRFLYRKTVHSGGKRVKVTGMLFAVDP